MKEALCKYVDLRGPLRKKLLTDLSQHMKSDEAKARLVELTTNKDMWASKVE